MRGERLTDTQIKNSAQGPWRARVGGWARISGLIVLAFLTLTLLLLGYCLAYPNSLKPLAESITEWALERPLQIDGDLSLSLSMTPVISVTDARLGNADGGTAPYMISAVFAQARIDLGALFEKRVHLLDLQAREAVLHLEDSVDGRPNWIFFEVADDAANDNSWSFMIQQLEVTDSRIHATIGELAPIELTIPHLVETSDAEDHLNLTGHGEINGDPWQVNGRIGPFDEILDAGRIELNLDLMLDDIELSAKGSIGSLAAMAALDLGLTIYGPDANLLGEIFRMPESFANDVALEAAIRPANAGHALRVVGHISDFDIETEGTITDLAEMNGWDGSALVRGPDLGVVGKALQIEGFPDGPFEIQGTLHLHGGDLDLKDVAVQTEDVSLTLNADFEQFPNREGAFGNFRLSGDNISEFRTLLRLPDLPAAPFALSLTLDATGTEVLRSTLTVGKHRLSAAGTIGDFPDFHGTVLTLDADGEDIAALLTMFGIKQPLAGRYNAASQLVVDTSGLSLRDSVFEMAGHTARGDLHWPDPMRPRQLEIRGELRLDNLADTGARFGTRGLPAYPMTGSGTLKLGDGVIELDESHIRLRSMEMKAQGKLDYPAALSTLSLDIEITGPRVDELLDDALPSADGSESFRLAAEIQGLEDALQIRAFQMETVGGTLRAEGRLAITEDWSGSQFTIRGSGSNLSDLIPAFPNYKPPEEPWQLQAEIELSDVGHLEVSNGRLEIGSVNMTLDGMLDTEDQTRTRLTFFAKGETIRDIGQIGDVPWPDHPFELTTELEGTMKALQFKTLEARWGDSDLSGGGSILLTDRPFVEVHGQSNVLDIYDLQHALFGAPEDIEPADDSAKVFPDTPIPMQVFAVFDGSIDLQVGRFRGRSALLDDVSLELDIKDGVLELNRVAYRDENGYFNASALLKPEGDAVYLELVVQGEDADFGLFTTTEQPRDSVPRYSLDVDIWSRGQTVSELAGNLNGKLLISSDGGEINNVLLEAFAGDFFSNVLETLNPFVKSEEFTQMECLVLNAAISDGRLKMAPGFVMRTDRLNMFVYGSADLERERLDLSLATQARQGIGLSAASITNPYFKVGGTLAAPALELDPASAAIAASVATATAGLSILVRGLFDRLMGTKNPCPNFLKYEQDIPEKPGARSES